MTGRLWWHQEPHPCLVFPTLFIRLSVVSQHRRKVSSRAISDCQCKKPHQGAGLPVYERTQLWAGLYELLSSLSDIPMSDTCAGAQCQ